MKRLCFLSVLALSCGLIALGCGDDDDGGSNGGGDKAEQTDTGGGGLPAGTDVSDDPEVKKAVEQCKRNIGAQPGVSENTKEKAKEICEKAAEGDSEAVREAARDICIEQAQAAPEGPARDAAVDACKKSTAGQ